MRIIKYILLTILLILGFTFACLNAATVNINYYFGSAAMPLSLLLVIAFIAGVILSILFSLGWLVRVKRKARKQLKQWQQEQALLLKSQE